MYFFTDKRENGEKEQYEIEVKRDYNSSNSKQQSFCFCSRNNISSEFPYILYSIYFYLFIFTYLFWLILFVFNEYILIVNDEYLRKYLFDIFRKKGAVRDIINRREFVLKKRRTIIEWLAICFDDGYCSYHHHCSKFTQNL